MHSLPLHHTSSAHDNSALVIALVGWREEHHIAVLITGGGYGADLSVNTKGIGPYQTDFKSIRGGYT